MESGKVQDTRKTRGQRKKGDNAMEKEVHVETEHSKEPMEEEFFRGFDIEDETELRVEPTKEGDSVKEPAHEIPTPSSSADTVQILLLLQQMREDQTKENKEMKEANKEMKEANKEMKEANKEMKEALTKEINRRFDAADLRADTQTTENKKTMHQLHQLLDDQTKEINKRLDTVDIRAQETNQRFNALEMKTQNMAKEVKESVRVEMERISNEFNRKLEKQTSEFHQKLEKQKEERKEELSMLQNQIREETLEQFTHQTDELSTKIETHQRQAIEQCNEYTNSRCNILQETLKDDINKNNGKIEGNSQKLVYIENVTIRQEEQLNDLTREIRENPIIRPQQIHVTCGGSGSGGADISLPKFHGREYNPMERLKKIRRYYERRRTTTNHGSEEELLHDTIEMCLEAHASRWFALIKEDVQTWEEFETEFEGKYWSREVQRGIKQRLDIEKFRNNGKLNRAEYFTERVITLRAMQPPLSDREIVTCLSEHYEPLIQDACRVQKIETIKDFELLLQREDLQEAHSRTRKHNIPTPQPRHQQKHPFQQQQQLQGDRNNHFQFKRPPPRNPFHFQPRFNPPQNYQNNHGQNRPPYNGQSNFRGPTPPPIRNPQPTNTYRPPLTFQRSNNHNQPQHPQGNRTTNTYPTDEQITVCHAVADRIRPPSPTANPSASPSEN